MTDEEMAEEYVKENCDDSLYSFIGQELQKAYLAAAELRVKRIAELEQACDETQKLLDKQIEATYKVVEKLNKAKEIISEFTKWANWQGNSKCPSFKSIQDKAEQFLKED